VRLLSDYVEYLKKVKFPFVLMVFKIFTFISLQFSLVLEYNFIIHCEFYVT
jgi:hypothetical protein